MLRRILLVSVGAIALSGAALAADLTRPPPPPVYVPPPPPPLWTGFYIGLNAGGTWSSNNTVNVDSLAINNPAFVTAPLASLPGALGATADIPVGSGGGFIGGGQVGYNYQFGPSFVAGIEADIQGIAGSTGRGNTFSSLQITGLPGNFVNTSLSVDQRLDYLGTVRGRLGWLVTPTLLLFGDGGLAYGGINADTFLTQSLVGPATTGVNTPYFSNGSINETRVGWTAGGGVEWMFLPNWSLKVEYLYYSLGSVTFNNGLASNVITAPAVIAGQTFYSIGTQSSTRFNGNIVRAGINYHFNWAPAPVVAKY
jgi:outer membrane immunogenic protein